MMGWTKQHRENLQRKADGGDQATIAELQHMRARNRENKRRSDARLRKQRAGGHSQQALQKLVHRDVGLRLKRAKNDATTEHPAALSPSQSTSPPPSSQSPPLPSPSTSVATMSRAHLAPSPPRDLLGGFVEAVRPSCSGSELQRPRETFGQVGLKPLSELKSVAEAEGELAKARALAKAVKERKKELKRMVRQSKQAKERK